MRLDEYVNYDATGLASLVRAGEVTAVELTSLAREAHDLVNPRINAVIEFYEDAETIAGVDNGLFAGVPFLRKDIGSAEAGRLQEQGSRLFRGYRPTRESHFYRRAREAGLRTVGRTATPEFGMSGMTETILNGITCNPWNLNRSASGSSGGAAASVAAGITPIAHASDGGGSIRQPAAWCGLVGLNPSRGRISGGPDRQDGWFGLSREFVLCRTVRDMAAALDAFSGSEVGDPFVIVQPGRPYIEELSRPTGKLRVGLAMTKWGPVDLEPEILQAVEMTASLLEEMGHAVTEIEPPYKFEELIEIMLGVSDLGARSLEIAAGVLGRPISADTVEPVNLKLYQRAQKQPLSRSTEVHDAIRRMRLNVGEAINAFDILLTPVMSIAARPHGGNDTLTNETTSVEEFMQAEYQEGAHLGVFNVTGQPSVSLPLAESAAELPIGIQIVGRFGDEATLVRVARDLGEARPWGHRRPRIWAGNN
ncbi:amidase [Ensifer aridi]|uniref:amidase n=1 Tax=Ensifer aridi TaxID=1708715 RepID=UPI0009BDB43E|nr:amidase [Ensifer aridi]